MRKLIIIFIASLLAFGGLASAATLTHIRFGNYPEKIRAVFDFDKPFTYDTNESKEKIVIRFKDAEAGAEIPAIANLDDLVVRYFEIEKEGNDLKVTIPLEEPVESLVFDLNDPPRLVLDFGREYLRIVSEGVLAEGVEQLKVKKGSATGSINATVLKIDLNKAEIFPALAKKNNPTFIESFIGFLTPWVKKEGPGKKFTLDKVSNIVSDSGALAGVNGTYFDGAGNPLGALIIDRDLISFPIYDRTAFFLDESNTPFIDNIFTSSHFNAKNGVSYNISGVNRTRGEADTILYTPAWGEATFTNQQGIEIAVSNSIVKEIKVSNTKIPEDGYVLSLSGPAVETLTENVSVGDPIKTDIKIIPYSASPKTSITHLISGGPRLLKNGRIYVSKHEEKFKADIARGKAARTAIGITRQNEILLVTVDGLLRKNARKDKDGEDDSAGATLEELSNLLLSLGATEAMNLDGGSSSTMVVGGRVVNSPTAGYQRKVSNALVVRSKT